MSKWECGSFQKSGAPIWTKEEGSYYKDTHKKGPPIYRSSHMAEPASHANHHCKEAKQGTPPL